MCLLGCGQSVLKKSQVRHETEECILRSMECPNGCGDMVVARDLERHNQICLRRTMPCGSCSIACTRTIESWLCGDIANGQGRLQTCDVHGSTALHWAAAVGDINVVRSLLGLTGARDIDLEARNDGTTALTRACIEGQFDVVKLLVEEGALLECETSRGYTPLICAVTRGWQEIAMFLANAGALIEYKNHLNKTALTWARELLGVKHPVFIKLNEIGEMQRRHRGLIQHITLDHFDEIYALVKDGAPHQFNCMAAMRETVREAAEARVRARAEIRDYSAELSVVQPVLDEKTATFDGKEAAVVGLKDKAVEIEKEADRLRQVSDKSIKAALFEIRGLPPSQIQAVGDIRYPDETQLVVMQAVCIMKGLKPKEKPDPRGNGDIILDWWAPARAWIRRHDFVRSMSNEMQIRLRISDEQLSALKDGFLDPECPNAHHFDYDAGGEDGEGYRFIEAMCQWVRSVEHYNTLERSFEPMQMQAQRLRVDYEKGMIALTGEREEVERLSSQWAIMTQAVADAKKVEEASTVTIEITEKRLRVAEMLSYRSLGGHSALTWAAMYGHTDTVEILLDHGAVLDYEDDHVHRAASLIQLQWRHVLYHKNRGPWGKLVAAQFQMRDIAHMFLLKSRVRQLRKVRKTIRTPLTEALYNGRLETVESLLARGALMSHATGIHPSAPLTGPFPSIRLNEASGAVFADHGPVLHVIEDHPVDGDAGDLEDDDNTTWTPLECAQRGKDDLGTFKTFIPPSEGGAAARRRQREEKGEDADGSDEDDYYADTSLRARAKAGGWDEVNRFDETLEKVLALQAKHEEKVRLWLEHRNGWLKARAEAKELLRLNRECGEAVNACEFERVAELWDAGAGCEFENVYGHTALTMAAAVEADGVNDDGEVVTAISLLLDREVRRPDIDHETKQGHTALTTACKNGRIRVIETLTDRGADINHVCKDGMSALLHAAKNGQWDCVRLLLERGADPFQRDATGKTASDWAMQRNLLGVVKMINNARAGNKGMAKANRGKALELFTCPLGCGKKMYKGDEMDRHERDECPKRIVPCRLGCGIQEMWAQERDAHEKNDCPKRLVPCPQKCTEMVHEDS